MYQGNLPMPYLESVLDVYESVLQKSPNYSDNAASKVKQEILHGLGNVSMPHGFQIIYTYMCVYYILIREDNQMMMTISILSTH